jgi:hypothetical protein
MKKVKLFEDYSLTERKITLSWNDDENSIVFSDGEIAQVDYDGDFKYRGVLFSTAEHTDGDDLIKDLQKKFKRDRFEWAFESNIYEGQADVNKSYDKVIELIRKEARRLNDDDAYEFHERLKEFFNKTI